MNTDDFINTAKEIKYEDTHFDFKSDIDWNNLGELIEVFKDTIALANSGGGVILVGVNNDGKINKEWKNENKIDQADFINKLKKYIDIQFYNFIFKEIERVDGIAFGIIIESSKLPIIFTNPGTYELADKKQKTAFGRGTLYFRHGAKSEPGNNTDIENAFNNELERVKISWLGNIRKVVEAPIDHIAYMAPPNVTLVESKEAIPIRITDSMDAPAYKIQNPDDFCPYRQKEVVQQVNQKLHASIINGYDITAINHVYKIDSSKPDFYYKSNFGPKQYSKNYVDYLVEGYKTNNAFFLETREKYKEIGRNT